MNLSNKNKINDMPEKFENIGLFYQKHYFRGITFDQNGNYKKGEASIIKERNNVLLRSSTLLIDYFYSSTLPNPPKLVSIYPGIITGIGMKHETAIEGELKLGMYFDYSSGMPCISGASIKGAIRAAFPQFVKHRNTDEKIKIAKGYVLNEILSKINSNFFPVIVKKPSECTKNDFNKIMELEEEIFDGKNFDETKRDEKGIKKDFLSVYEKDIFHDAFIVKADSKGRILGDDAITHHPSPLKNPNPVLFLKMMPGITVQFNFEPKNGSFLSAIEKNKLFTEIILYYGIGAKTNVGYGQFTDEKAIEKTGNKVAEKVQFTQLNQEKTLKSIAVDDILDAKIINLSGGLTVDLGISDISFKPRLIGVTATGYSVGQIIKVKVDQIGKQMKFGIVH